MTLEGLALMV
jgi:hypothetical protein